MLDKSHNINLQLSIHFSYQSLQSTHKKTPGLLPHFAGEKTERERECRGGWQAINTLPYDLQFSKWPTSFAQDGQQRRRVCVRFSLWQLPAKICWRCGCHCQTTTMRTMAYNKSCPTHAHTHTHAMCSPADRAGCVWGAPFSCRNWRNKIEQFIDLRSIWCAIIAPNLPEIKKKKEQKESREKRGSDKRRNNKGRVCV